MELLNGYFIDFWLEKGCIGFYNNIFSISGI